MKREMPGQCDYVRRTYGTVCKDCDNDARCAEEL